MRIEKKENGRFIVFDGLYYCRIKDCHNHSLLKQGVLKTIGV